MDAMPCRNVKLSEESLKRHFDMLFEITVDFILAADNRRKPRGITELYEALNISTKLGDKILDRLEECWGYIVCERARRFRKYCIPTIYGIIELAKRPEYRAKLINISESYKKNNSEDNSEEYESSFIPDILSTYFKFVDMFGAENLVELLRKIRELLSNEILLRGLIIGLLKDDTGDDLGYKDEELTKLIAKLVDISDKDKINEVVNKVNEGFKDPFISAFLDFVSFLVLKFIYEELVHGDRPILVETIYKALTGKRNSISLF